MPVYGPAREPIETLSDKVRGGDRVAIAEIHPAKCETLQSVHRDALVVRCDVRSSAEVESLRARLASTDGLNTEVTHLKQERDVIRTRVTDMLAQLEALSL